MAICLKSTLMEGFMLRSKTLVGATLLAAVSGSVWAWALPPAQAPSREGAALVLRVADFGPAYAPRKLARRRHIEGYVWQPWAPRYCNTFREWEHVQRR